MAKNNKTGGCGTGLGIFLAIYVIGLLHEYSKVVVGIVAVVAILALVYYATK